jgi:tetratricopeptide (TPR) repeat protein
MKSHFLYFFILTLCFITACKETNDELIRKAINLTNEEKYKEAITIYSRLIHQNNKFQLPYYNRGLVYYRLEKYPEALLDFQKVISLKTLGSGNIIFTYNQDSPFADEEAKMQVPYHDVLYEIAQVKYFMDSLKSSYTDFEILVANNYEEKSNCLLWQGTIWHASGDSLKACNFFNKAKSEALTQEDIDEANKMVETYCK